VIKRVMLVGVGAAAGWLAHTVFSKGRDAAAVKAEEALRNTLNPENIGRNAGQAAATALAASARSFAYQLREEVPAWKTAQSTLADPASRAASSEASGAGQTTISGTATETPTDSRKQS
jgi:predicted secreted protein